MSHKLCLTCPACKKRLPQIGSEILDPGDSVTCGMCGHVWMPIAKQLNRQGNKPKRTKS